MIYIEIWKDIEGYEGLYYVSSLGKIKNSNNLIMKQRDDKDGYKRISLTKKVGNIKSNKTFFIHRLVAKAFIENNNNYECINHINEDKTNNSIYNLEWCSRKYNNNYGTRKIKNYFKNFKTRKVIDLTSNIIYSSMHQAGKAGNVTSGAIYNCCIGRNKTCYGHKFVFYDDYLVIQEAI